MKSKKKKFVPASPYHGTKYSRNGGDKISEKKRQKDNLKRWKEGEPMKGTLGDTVTIKDGKILVNLEKKEVGS